MANNSDFMLGAGGRERLSDGGIEWSYRLQLQISLGLNNRYIPFTGKMRFYTP